MQYWSSSNSIPGYLIPCFLSVNYCVCSVPIILHLVYSIISKTEIFASSSFIWSAVNSAETETTITNHIQVPCKVYKSSRTCIATIYTRCILYHFWNSRVSTKSKFLRPSRCNLAKHVGRYITHHLRTSQWHFSTWTKYCKRWHNYIWRLRGALRCVTYNIACTVGTEWLPHT